MIPSSYVTLDNNSERLLVSSPYLNYVAVDTGKAEILRQVTSTKYCHMQSLLVDRMNDFNAYFRLQIHCTIQWSGHGFETSIYKTLDPR